MKNDQPSPLPALKDRYDINNSITQYLRIVGSFTTMGFIVIEELSLCTLLGNAFIK